MYTSLVMNKLNTAKRVAVVAALVEDNSVRATARMTNVSKPTILKLLGDLGAICAAYQDEMIRNVKAARVQVDESGNSCMQIEERSGREARHVRRRRRVDVGGA